MTAPRRAGELKNGIELQKRKPQEQLSERYGVKAAVKKAADEADEHTYSFWNISTLKL